MFRTKTTDTLTQSYNHLTVSLLSDFLGGQAKENIAFSPFSIMMLLAILVSSTDGETRQEIEKYLAGAAGPSQGPEMARWLQKVQRSLAKGSALASANAVLVDEAFRKWIREEYIRQMERSYDGQVIASEDLVNDTNKWVREKTRGMIDKVLESAPDSMTAILLNAISFDAEWETKYRKDDVTRKDFHNEDGSTSRVSMLKSTEDLYVEDRNVTGFIKQYKGAEYSFMALLPKKKGPEALRAAAAQLNLSDLYSRRTHGEVSVLLPEFESQYEVKLKDHLREKGIRAIFSQQGDFTPMSDHPLLVDEILHKAKIEVDRKGTRAAAVTMAMVIGCSMPMEPLEKKIVHLDRPFLYAVMHNETGLPVFVGAVRGM